MVIKINKLQRVLEALQTLLTASHASNIQSGKIVPTVERGRRRKGRVAIEGRDEMADLKGSKTEDNLKAAFAGESQANRRYLYFAQKADVEGYNDVAVVFRSTAEGETGHAHGHLEFLEEVGDPATGLPIGGTPLDLRRRSQRDARVHRHVSRHGEDGAGGGVRRSGRWFETLAKAEKSHAGRFQKALDSLD